MTATDIVRPSRASATRTRAPRAVALTILLAGGLGLGVGLAAGSLAKSTGRDVIGVERIGGVTIAVVVALAVNLVIALHELGHLVAGLAQGNRFMLFAAGPLLVRREAGVVRWQFNRSAAFWGGIAATLPLDVQGLRANLYRVVLCGPLASLLSALLAAAVFPLTEGALRSFVGMLGLGSAGVFLATMLPPRSGGFYSDGARLRMLRAGGDDAERWCTGTALGVFSMAGLPSAEWDAALVQRAEALADDSMDGIMLHLALHERASDMGLNADATRHMHAVRDAREGLAPAMAAYVSLESAYWAAVGERDAAVARAEWARVTPSPFLPRISSLRAEGAVLMSEGQVVEAHSKLDAAAALIAKATGDPSLKGEGARIARARAIG